MSQKIETKLNSQGRLEIELVTEFPNKSSEIIYGKIEEWVAYNFKNTESVIQSQIENKMIRINGISSSVIRGPMGVRYGLYYEIQIDIKKERTRFRVYNIQLIGESNSGTKSNVELSIYKNNGEPRKGKTYKNIKIDTDNEIDKLYNNFILFLENENAKNDDW